MSSSKKIDCIDNWFDAENQLKIYFLYSNDPFKNEKKWKKWIAIIIIPSGYIFYMVDTIDYHQRQQQNSIQKNEWMLKQWSIEKQDDDDGKFDSNIIERIKIKRINFMMECWSSPWWWW